MNENRKGSNISDRGAAQTAVTIRGSNDPSQPNSGEWFYINSQGHMSAVTAANTAA
jgi:hypothetical protein